MQKRAKPKATRKGSRGSFRAYARSHRRLLFFAVPAALAFMFLAALLISYVLLKLPDTLPPVQSSILLDRNGQLLTRVHGVVDRRIVPLSAMSENVQNAVIATEDHGFYEHQAVDPIGIFRAAFANAVKGRTVQGGSTITEQLVKNVYAGSYKTAEDGSLVYVTPPRTIREKFREALMAIKLERRFSKDQILANYLNTVYFGHGAYGVQAAARTYFGKPATDLTVLESASLAGTLHAPSLYDPADHPYDNKFRRDYALEQMAEYGYITTATAEQLKKEPCCGTVTSRETVDTPGLSEYFVDYTKRYLKEKYGSARLYGGGLRVTTSLDLGLQAMAEKAVQDRLPQTPENPSVSMVAMDPSTGQVLAMVGGRDFNESQVNLATFQGGTGRQAGSAFKPFTLAAALANGYSLRSYWYGPSAMHIYDPKCYSNGEPWYVTNAGDESSGYFSLERATWHSVNTVYAQLVSKVGPQKVANTANAMGIRSKLAPYCSVTLGSVAVNPLEMTNAYSTLAANGIRRWATPLVSVGGAGGTITEQGTRVMTTKNAAEVTQALTGVITYGTGYRADIGRPAAGKTGTAKDSVDVWFCGYTPQIVTCVWMGWPEGEIPLQNIGGYWGDAYGGAVPASIWHDFMLAAHADLPVKDFVEPTEDRPTYYRPTYPSATTAPTASATPSATATPTPTIEPSPTLSPSPTPPPPTEEPTPTPEPVPAPSSTPKPTATSTSSPTTSTTPTTTSPTPSTEASASPSPSIFFPGGASLLLLLIDNTARRVKRRRRPPR